MAHQPLNSTFSINDLIGDFKLDNNNFEYQGLEKLDVNMFEYNKGEYPHAVWVSSNPVGMCGYRAAKVLKTVAYVVVDEDDAGNPVVEKWVLKAHTVYTK